MRIWHIGGKSTPNAVQPADALKRAVRRRSDLVERRTGCYLRLDALVELLGPAWTDVLGTGNDIGVTALEVLERYADPRNEAPRSRS